MTYSAQTLLHRLSPPFGALNDAARYAAAQIDRTKGRSCGGYIFTDAQGYCRASYPQEGRLEDFLFSDVETMVPAFVQMRNHGYQYEAYYFCDIDRHAQISRLRPGWSASRITLTQSVPCFEAVLATSFLRVFYTVGPQGSLVRFVLNEGPMPQDFVLRMRARLKGQATPALPLDSEPVEAYIQELLAVGQVSVVVSSPVWAGWRADLSSQWRAYLPNPNPIVQEPYLGPILDDPEKVMALVHEQLLRNPDAQQVGFILKHRSRQAFMATEPVVVAQVQFDPAVVFRSDNDGNFFIPHIWTLVGAYTLCADVPAPPKVRQPWLYERFIQPLPLAHAINLSRVVTGGPGFGFYLSTYDGAQLKLLFANAQAQSPFFNPTPTSQRGIDNNLNAGLVAGVMTPLEFVRKVAAASELTVLRTSLLWDVPGRVGAQWKPYARHALTFGPAFVMADDAARYAHEQIGSRRDHSYIGLILQRDDHRFVATEPLANPGGRFDLSQVYPLDRHGQLILLPKGHRVRGIYSSRRRAENGAFKWSEEEAAIAGQMFTDTDLHAVFGLQQDVPLAYLSGSADSLLCYEPFAPGMAHDLRARVAPGPGGSEVQHQLQDGTLQPGDLVRETVLGGLLRVVVGSRVWGPAGKVESDWSGPFEPDEYRVASPPELGPVFATAAQAVEHACARGRTRYAIGASGLGLVIKHVTLDEFAATPVLPGHLLDRLYHAAEFGAPVLIDEFRVYAVYYACQRMARALVGQEAWLARHFIDAQALYQALYDERGVRRGGLMSPLPLYCSPLDGALLEFHTRQDPFPLFVDDSGQVDPQVLPAKLALTLTPRSYVRHMAASGQLSVRVPSECWDVPGRVGADWLAFAHISRRLLGPVFSNADDAARYALERLGARRDRVYGGLILRRTDGLFTATEPLPVQVEDFAPGWIRLDELVTQAMFLHASTCVARYHSRVAGEVPFALPEQERAVYWNMFSTAFLAAILSPSTVPPRHSVGPEYLLCDDDALLCYTPSHSALEQSLEHKVSVRGRDKDHPERNDIERSFRDGTLTPSEFVNRVARAGELRVVQGSALWGAARTLTHWVPGAVSAMTGPVAADTGLTPVFAQRIDLQAYLHRLAGARERLQFGLLLKARHVERYVASVPLPGDSGALSLDRVMLDGLPPQDYELLGLYLCPPARADILEHDPLYGRFVSPQDLARAWGVRTPTHHAYLPIYVGCVDGAWLKLNPTSATPFAAGMPSTEIWRQLKAGRLQALAYVRQLAGALEIQVEQVSTTWSVRGKVDADWVAGTKAADSRQNRPLLFGPLFSHPDDAARATAHRMGTFQKEQGLGAILVDAARASFIAAEPLEDHGIESSVPQRLFLYESTLLFPDPPTPDYPKGYQLQACHLFYKTMGEGSGNEDLAAHFVSRDELGFYRNLLKVGGVQGAFCYLTTRQGALLKYQPRFTPREEELFTGQLFFGPVDYQPTEWLSRLATDGHLYVLEPDDYWTLSGLLHVDWSVRDGQQQPHMEVQPQRPAKDEF
jgi:hypothetical protein